MKFPFSMLRDFVETSLTAVEVGALLTMAGFELEGIEEVEGDHVLDIKVVSNRGDGLSVFGLSREVLAKDKAAKATSLYDDALRGFPVGDEAAPDAGSRTTVVIDTPECTRYACRLYENLSSKPGPEWMQKRLRQAGMRPISLLVDLTNYVMLEMGQPLHAFDFDKLAGHRIVVRNAEAGDKLTTLNGEEHELQGDQIMICDAEKPVATAGIMGGLESEVTDATKKVLLESAHFTNTSVRRIRKQLGLSTEASYRFERSVDPEGVVRGLNRFTRLLADADPSATIVPGVVDVYPHPPEPKTLSVRMSRTSKLLGMHVPTEDAQGYLQGLGFDVSGDGEPFEVAAPTWRPDIIREDDLVEEIGRVHGFDKIPETPLQGTTVQGGVGPEDAVIDRIREEVIRHGMVQIISHSLRDLSPLDEPGDRIGPRTPASPDTTYLRNSLLPSLADAARRNGGKNLHLFEIGRVFSRNGGSYEEGRRLGLLSQGELYSPYIGKEQIPSATFFSLKTVLEDALRVAGVEVRADAASQLDRRLHPTRQAAFLGTNGEHLGFLGQIHPDIAEQSDLPATTVLAEIDLEKLTKLQAGGKRYKPISRNPAVRLDIAVVVDKSTPYRTLETKIREAAGDVLERQWLFDIYEGAGIPEGKHSLAIALQLRKMGENFTIEEASQVRDSVVRALAEVGATLRE